MPHVTYWLFTSHNHTSALKHKPFRLDWVESNLAQGNANSTVGSPSSTYQTAIPKIFGKFKNDNSHQTSQLQKKVERMLETNFISFRRYKTFKTCQTQKF